MTTARDVRQEIMRLPWGQRDVVNVNIFGDHVERIIAAALSERERETVEWLKRFCWHTDGCASIEATPGGIKRLPCDCGLDTALADAARRETP